MPIAWSFTHYDPAGNPYFDWITGPGRAQAREFDENPITLLFELAPGASIEELLKEFFAFDPDQPMKDEGPSQSFVPDIYRSINGRYATGIVRINSAEAIRRLYDSKSAARSVVQRIIPGRALPEDAWAGSSDALGYSGTSERPAKCSPPGKVVVGIIDEGLGIANARFRRSLKRTCVDYFWHMDGNHDQPVMGFTYGKEFNQMEINHLLDDCSRSGQIDENKFYARLGSADFAQEGHKAVSRRVTHGTHIMDLAVGGNGCEHPEDWHTIVVQLPSAIVAETSGLGLEGPLLDAVNYINSRAATIAGGPDKPGLPLVINFSSGIRAGPHDGTSEIEAALCEFIERRRDNGGPPTQIVLPAGNSFLARSHATFALEQEGDDGDTDCTNWLVPADDRTHSYIEIWVTLDSPADKDFAALKLTTPGGVASEWMPANSSDPAKNAMVLVAPKGNGRVLCKVYYQQLNELKGRYLIALVPTASHNVKPPLAPSGQWEIALKNCREAATTFEAWIHWDDAPISYRRRGRQSFFRDFRDKRVDDISGRDLEEDQEGSPVKRFGTISAIATEPKTVTVAGYHGKEHRAAKYSSGDFAGQCNKPDFMAVSEDSTVLTGVLAAGSRSGSTVALNGTSVAAPQVTRKIAELMAAGKSDADIEAMLINQAGAMETALQAHGPAHPGPLTDVPEERRGKGRLDLKKTRESQRLRLKGG